LPALAAEMSSSIAPATPPEELQMVPLSNRYTTPPMLVGTPPIDPPMSSALHHQIEEAMRGVMYDMVATTVAKETLTEADADWLASLLAELRDRLNALTPNRPDFHAELARSLDVPLARQMLLHGAADESDVIRLVEVVHDRLKMMCAPVQDADVDDMRAACLSEASPAHCLATLLTRADRILSFTEALNQQIQQQILEHQLAQQQRALEWR
jgi:hypothetical protein